MNYGHHRPRLYLLEKSGVGDILGEYFPRKEVYLCMRNIFYSLLVAIVSLGLSTADAAEPSNVRIDFVHPERFSDFSIQGRQEITSAPIFRDQVSSYLSRYVASRFPGATLTLRFTDIDLAGRLEPWRIRKFNDVRFDRTMGASPLRLYFDYTLTDSKGRILASGSRALVDGDYINRYVNYPNIEKSATLFYEKVTLKRWFDYLTPSGSSIAGK